MATKRCKPCERGTAPLSRAQAEGYLEELPGWQLSPDAKSIFREYLMKNFTSAIQLVGEIAQVAESEDHHPDLHVTGYRKLRIDLATHSIGGLSENDFILAAKIDALPKSLKP